MVTINEQNEGTAASGKILLGGGVGTASVFSTATYPATAGSSGNVLESDGTNFTSVASSGGASYQGSVQTATGDPSDSTTYYPTTASGFTIITVSTFSISRFYAPVDMTITKVYGAVTVEGTLGGAQNCTVFIRVNDTTNTNITTTLQLTGTRNTFSNTGLSIALSAGDFFIFGFTGGAFSPNPTTVSLTATWST